ncbi:antibiotic biosynthesis monooxygenase family protein [Mesorhizobium sp. 1B3]|uniref:antibiotic biosynthesis monooxygenase family protein n=1 Tax=Mesorhizobium sp. 1B3 TaxID=3243599 RepID=UPI003D97CE8A
MIREVATILVAPENTGRFEEAVAAARPIIMGAEGCLRMHLERVVEVEGSYRLIVDWETIEHHTMLFRNSRAFEEWHALAKPFFLEPPAVVHTEIVAS